MILFLRVHEFFPTRVVGRPSLDVILEESLGFVHSLPLLCISKYLFLTKYPPTLHIVQLFEHTLTVVLETVSLGTCQCFTYLHPAEIAKFLCRYLQRRY